MWVVSQACTYCYLCLFIIVLLVIVRLTTASKVSSSHSGYYRLELNLISDFICVKFEFERQTECSV